MTQQEEILKRERLAKLMDEIKPFTYQGSMPLAQDHLTPPQRVVFNNLLTEINTLKKELRIK